MIRRAEHRLYRTLHNRLSAFGRREAFQLLFGAAWIFYGISIILEPPRNLPGLFQVTNYIHPAIYGGMWIVSGCIAMTAGMNKGRKIDRWGFAALIVPPLLRGVVSVLSWIGLLLGWDSGDPRGWSSALIWISSALAIQIVAGWPEPHVTVPGRRHFFLQELDEVGPSTKEE